MKHLGLSLRLIVLAALLVVWSPSSRTVAGQSATPETPWRPGDTARVTADYLNVRSEPGTDAAIVETLTNGAEVTIVSASDSQPNWVEVRVGDKTGWISTRFIERVGAPSALVAPSATVAPNRPSLSTATATRPPLAPVGQDDLNLFGVPEGLSNSARVDYLIETLTASQIGVWFIVAVVAGAVLGFGLAKGNSKSPWLLALLLPFLWAGAGWLVYTYRSQSVDPSNVLATKLTEVAGVMFGVVASLCSWIAIWAAQPRPAPVPSASIYADDDREDHSLDWLFGLFGAEPKRRDDDD